MALPYPRAWMYLTGVFGLAILAFWPQYFSRLAEVPLVFHIHGLTGMAWLALLISQTWSIHHRSFAVHRLGGRIALVLAPLFIGGGLLTMQTMQITRTPFNELYALRLVALDMVATLAFAGFFLAALLVRRRPALHGRFMIATVFLLSAPITGRLIPIFMPGLTIRGIEDFPRFATGLHLGNVIAIAIALGLYLASRRQGWPFLIAAGILVLQSAAFKWAGSVDAFLQAMAVYRTVPPVYLFAFGTATGALISWIGWVGGRTARPAAPVAGEAG